MTPKATAGLSSAGTITDRVYSTHSVGCSLCKTQFSGVTWMRYNNDNGGFRCYDVTGSGEILDANTCLIFFFAVSSSQVKTDAKYVFSSCGTQRSSGIWPSRKKRSLMEKGSFGFSANNNLTESHLSMLSVRSKRQVTTTTASTSATTTAVTTTVVTTTTTTITTTTTRTKK